MLLVTLWDNFNAFFRSLATYSIWQVLIELSLIWVVVFWVLRFLQGTRGARLLRGIVLLLISFYVIFELLSSILDLNRIKYLYDRFLFFIAAAVIVVFQPELRRALMRLGETKLFRTISTALSDQIDALVEAAMFCSRRKIGMLVAIERDVGLGGIADSGTRLNAELSSELLNTIFWPNSPLHDLGVIVSNGRITWAGVQFPLAESGDLEKELGSRHRAAVGLSQESDAVVLVVSEETGDISIAERGVLYRKLSPEALRDTLEELLGGGNKSIKQIVTDNRSETQVIHSKSSTPTSDGSSDKAA
ncbi:MAG: cyclic di-AMP synthase CdaA [Phycisphaerae bacterium]|jgi:diadenylate cyclase|nr:MAG: cyclic di-AMP synthase CdaA [Phycisphaerae bacterium]